MNKQQMRAALVSVVCITALTFGCNAGTPVNRLSAMVGGGSALAGNTKKMSPEQEKAIEAWTNTLAVQAATYGAPLVAMYNLRAKVAFGPKAKAAPNTIWRLEDISTPKLSKESGYVSPNVNVVYGFGFADLGQEPIILTAPDSGGRYYMIEVVDMWTNDFAYPRGSLRLQGWEVRIRWPWLEGQAARRRETHRRANALD